MTLNQEIMWGKIAILLAVYFAWHALMAYVGLASVPLVDHPRAYPP